MPASQRSFCAVLLTLCLFPNAGWAQKVDLERTNLLIGLGRVENLVEGVAVLDLGQAHTLMEEDRVAIFRREGRYHVPVGVLKVKEAFPDFARTYRTALVRPERGDLALFVREFRQMRTADQHVDAILKSHMVRTSSSNRTSSGRGVEAAMAMLDYGKRFKKWERSDTEVVGYLRGASFMNGERKSIEPLLRQMDLIREQYRQGQTCLSAAGPAWEQTMSVLFGPALIAQHEAASSVVLEDDLGSGPGKVRAREVRRQAKLRFYDRLEAEQNLLAMFAASLLESPPKREELWYADKTRRSQFPDLGEQELIFEELRRMVQALRDDV